MEGNVCQMGRSFPEMGLKNRYFPFLIHVL